MKLKSSTPQFFYEDFSADIGKTALKKTAQGFFGIGAVAFFNPAMDIAASINTLLPVCLLAAPLIVISEALLKTLLETKYFHFLSPSFKENLSELTLHLIQVAAIASAAFLLQAPVLLTLMQLLILPVSLFLLKHVIQLLEYASSFIPIATLQNIGFSALGYAACSFLGKCALSAILPSLVNGVSFTTVASVGALTAPLTILPILLIRFLTEHYVPHDSSKKRAFLLIAETLLQLAATTAAIHLLSAPFAACFICTLIIPTTLNLLKNLCDLRSDSHLKTIPDFLLTA